MRITGVILVMLGALSYGLPASLMKLAKQNKVWLPNMLFFQFLSAFIILWLIFKISQRITPKQYLTTKQQKIHLLLSGIALALTTTFYFIALSFVPVAIAAVMLMQSVWITALLDYLIKKIKPTRMQIGCIVIILLGTILATNVLNTHIQTLSTLGLWLSFCAGLCYAITIQVTNSLANNANPIERSFLVAGGALITIILIWGWQMNFNFLISSFSWGILIAVFSIVFPLLCFTFGMPKITAGMGGLLSSLELPAAITFAFLLINETITTYQFLGVILIISAVALINYKRSYKRPLTH